MLSLWEQQWPRLRRTFRFCTLAFGDRSVDGAPFDLQFVPGRERSIRSRFTGVIDSDRLPSASSNWMEAVLDDLFGGESGNLRQFLREMGGDLAGGREAFVPLCRLHSLISEFGQRAESVEDAISLLNESFGTQQGSSVKAMIVAAIALQAVNLDGNAVDFVLENLDLLAADHLPAYAVDIGTAIWKRNPDTLVQLLSEQGSRHFVAEHTLTVLATDDIFDGLRTHPQIMAALLRNRPEILADSGLWAIRGPWCDDAIAFAAADRTRSETVVAAMIASGRSDLATRAVSAFGSLPVLAAVGQQTTASANPSEVPSDWISAAVNDPESVARALTHHLFKNLALLVIVARKTFPDFVPNNYGDDPWWTAIRDAHGDLNQSSRQFLAAYLLARALGHRSRSQAELIEFTLDDVYFPAQRSMLSTEAWNTIEPKLPRSWFFDWDYCQRIRERIVEVFIDRELSAENFARVTHDDDLFSDLVTLAERSGKGRKLLKKALKFLTAHAGSSRRIEALRAAL